MCYNGNTRKRGVFMKYYAVREGRSPGIYNTWEECSKEVIGYKGAIYKKFTSYEEALNFMNDIEKKDIQIEDELKEDEIIAYVDGSFSTDINTYSYGVVIISNNGKESFNGYDNNLDMAKMRNVSGELMGAIEAIKWAIERKKKRLYLHYDYAGIENWAKGNWKTNKEGTKAYKKFYDSIKGKIDIQFIKVKAHSGVKYNEEADLLAKKAIEGIN